MNFDRSIKPEPIEEISFALPGIKHFTLQNGLRIIFVPKHTLPILQLNLMVDAGSKYDPHDKKGLANLTAMTIDEGAGGYDALELSDEFDLLGTHFNAHASNDNIHLSLQSLSEHFDRSLKLFGKVLLKPYFDDSAFHREKRKIITRIMQVKDDPAEIADTAFEHIIFGKINPYSYPSRGYEDTVANISNEDVKKFYTQYFTPERSYGIIVGDIDEAGLKDKLNYYFNTWKPADNKILLEVSQIKNKAGVYLADKKGSVQSEIRIGHIAPKRDIKDYFPKAILNIILGGQFSSRINLNLREKHGYTYGASSRFSYYKDNAHFSVSTSVGIENTLNAVNEIIKELNEIKNGITSAELDFAKSSIMRQFPSQFETYRQIAANLMGKVMHSLPDDYFNTYLDNVKNVTKQDVDSIAVKNIFPDELVIAIVGDKEKILKQFVDSGLGEIVEVDLKGETLNP